MTSVSTDAWCARGQRARLLGRSIFFVDTEDDRDGSGGSEDDADASRRPTVFLIHGFPTSSWDWTPIWDRLAATHRLVALDLLGFGFSDKPNPHTYTIHEQADLCEALIEERGLERFHVLAHDYGDTVAQELLARQNDGVGAGEWRSLCLLNGGLFPETHRPRLIQKLLLSPLGPAINALSSKRTFDRSFSGVFGAATRPSPEELDAFWRLILHDDGKIMHRLIRYIPDRVAHRERWVDALVDSVVPIGLINGSVDPVSGAHMVERYRELLGEPAFMLELPTIGHYPQVEAPDEVLRGYLRFLETVGDLAGPPSGETEVPSGESQAPA